MLPEFRPMRPDGLAAFCDRSLNPAQLHEQLAAFLAAGSVLPEWCWTATGAGGAVLARHYWWGVPGSGKPTVVTSVSAEDQAAAAGLLVHARDRLGVEEARCEVIAPHGQGDPGTVRADLVALLTAAGLMTPRLRLAPLTVPDADEMVLVLSDARLYEFIGGTAPSTDELRARYGRLVLGRSPDGSQVWHNWIVRTLNGAAVGTVQATVTDSGTRAEVAWVIGQPYWGQGYASEAATGVVCWLARAGVGEVLAHIHPGHRASQAVARRAGLRPTDVFQDGEQRWTRRFDWVSQ